MSNKFFSLLQGEKLHLAPGVKIIPGESISTIMHAEEVLKTVNIQSEEYKMQVAAECEKLKEQAKQEGFEKGYFDWIEKLALLDEEIKKVRKEAENMIFPIALKAAKKIVGRELEISKSAVTDIISNSLKSVASHKKIKLYVNKKEFEQVERNKEQLKKIFENLEVLSIIPQDNIESAGCIIETEGGIINAQLENQWMILETAFQRLAKLKKTEGEAPSQVISKPVEIKKEPLPTPEKLNEKKEEKNVDQEEEEWEEDDEEWEEDENEDTEDYDK